MRWKKSKLYKQQQPAICPLSQGHNHGERQWLPIVINRKHQPIGPKLSEQSNSDKNKLTDTPDNDSVVVYENLSLNNQSSD